MLGYSSRALLHLAITVAINMTVAVSTTGLKEYCRKEYFNATCPSGQVVMMKQAHYGRRTKNRCVDSNHNLGCGADVLPEMDRRCSGKSSCSIRIPDEELQEKQSCPGDTIGYLEAEYTCLEVAKETSDTCLTRKELEITDRMSGYIASSSTRPQGLGTSKCPWVITMAAGQRINITLMDFSEKHRSQKPPGTCLVYFTIREDGESDVPICSKGDRSRQVYVSTGNRVKIEINQLHASNIRFLLKYDAVGCTDPTPPYQGYVTRNGETAKVACNYTNQKWHIVCYGNQWFGTIQNCTDTGVTTPDRQADTREVFNIGLIIAVITGIFLGVVIGVLMLAIVFCMQKRRKRLKAPEMKPGQPHMQSLDYVTGQDSPFLEKSPPPDPGYGYTHVWPGVKAMHPHVSQDELSPPTKDLLAREGTLKSLGRDQINKYQVGYEKAFTVEVKLGSGNGNSGTAGEPSVAQVPMYHEFDHNTLERIHTGHDLVSESDRHMCHPCDLHAGHMPR